MKILIGICGIGNGHSIRQSLIIEKLIQRGAQTAVFCFGKSLEFMTHSHPHEIPFQEVSVPWIYANNHGIEWEKTEIKNLNELQRRNHLNAQAFKAVPEIFGGHPDICISDYEPVTAKYAYQNDIPLITIDQQSKFLGFQTEDVREYSRMEERSRLSYFFPYAEARFAVSFYPMNVEKDKDYDVEIVPALVRKEIVKAQIEKKYSSNDQENDSQVLVYFSPYGPLSQNIEDIIRVLRKFKDKRFIIYNSCLDRSPSSLVNTKNITFESFDRISFAQNLVSADCIISTAGHTLVSEAVYLSKPIYTIPLSTYDQHYCTKMVDRYKVGMSSSEITEIKLDKFFSNLQEFKNNFAQNNRFTVESEISESLIVRIWETALSHPINTRNNPDKHSSSIIKNSAFQSSPIIKDNLINPIFEELSSDSMPPRQPDYKVAVVKPTMKCVGNCLFCQPRSKNWWDEDLPEITLQQWTEVFSQLRDIGFERIIISGGEPLLYPYLGEMIGSIRANGLVALLNTNGYLLSPDKMKALYDRGLNGINFSLDSPKPSIHDWLRNRPGVWKKCVDAIKNAGEYNDRSWVAIRMVLNTYNLMDLPEMIQLAVKLGASSLKLSYLEWSHQGSFLLPSVETLKRFKDAVLPCCIEHLELLNLPSMQKKLTHNILKTCMYSERMNTLEHYAKGQYWNKGEHPKHCKIPYSLIIIYGDGRVLPCNAAEYARISLPGNLQNKSLENILNNGAMEDFRENLPDFCIYCPMGLHVTLPLRATTV